MKLLPLLGVLAGSMLMGGTALAQTPGASPSASPSAIASPGASVSPTTAPSPTVTPSPTPVTTVPQFPSTPHYLRAFPGAAEESWYVYASGFTPRTDWVLVEVPCGSLPCAGFHPTSTDVVANDAVKEDGTMTFYAQLRGAKTSPRLLAAVAQPLPMDVPADAPTMTVAGHNAGVGLGYPKGTKTGVAAVDEVVALSQAGDTAALRARLVLKDGTTTTGSPVHGLANWQCQPFINAEAGLAQSFEYPSQLVYAVFRVPDDPALPLRYRGAAYGIAWYDGGAGVPLGGLTLVSEGGQVVGVELRCGTTPAYHVHNFTDFILAPFTGPPPATSTVTPAPPSTGNGHRGGDSAPAVALLVLGLALAAAGGVTGAVMVRRRR